MPLRFKITASRTGWPQEPWRWYVIGNRVDWSDDYCWGNFTNWADALRFALDALKRQR